MKKVIYIMFSVMFLLATACNEDDLLAKKVNFDRKALLEHYADHIIPKHYKLLNNNTLALDTAWKSFKLNPNENSLSLLRYYFVETYKAWQYCSVFEIGPAEQILLRANMNTFPTDTFKIGTNIRNENYNLSTASNIDAKGLPALDYLFFKQANMSLSFLIEQKNQFYIDAIISDIKNNVNTVYTSWTNGIYRNEFVAKDGVDIGSALGQMVNQINFDLEIIKTAKLGIPLGKKTMGTPLPNMVEAYYSGISKDLILLNLNSLKNIFAGNVNDQILGTGLDEYLRAVSAKSNGVDLDIKIVEQLEAARTAIEAIPNNLSEAILNQTTTVESAYTEVQRCIIYTKTDMPSALGIMITYQDNDGD